MRSQPPTTCQDRNPDIA